MIPGPLAYVSAPKRVENVSIVAFSIRAWMHFLFLIFFLFLNRRWFIRHPWVTGTVASNSRVLHFSVSLGNPSARSCDSSKTLQRTSLRSSVCRLGYTLRRRGPELVDALGSRARVLIPISSPFLPSSWKRIPEEPRITRWRFRVYETYS